MKKYIGIIILLLILFANIASASASAVRNLQDNYRFVYTLRDENGDPISGQTITLRIQKISNGYWYDFSDNTFKASGWVSATTNLFYDTTGEFYHYLFDPPASEASAEEYIFVIDNASATYGDHQSEVVCYQDIGTGSGTPTTIAGAIWDEGLSGHLTAGSTGKKLSEMPTPYDVGP